MEILAHWQPWLTPWLSHSFSQTTVWHSSNVRLNPLRGKDDKYPNTHIRSNVHHHLPDLLGADFSLWQDSLAVPVFVWLFFCLPSVSNFNTWQDLPQSTAILSIFLFMSYSCRGLQWCRWQGVECLALVWVIRATNSTEREAQHKSLCVCLPSHICSCMWLFCVCMRQSHLRV